MMDMPDLPIYTPKSGSTSIELPSPTLPHLYTDRSIWPSKLGLCLKAFCMTECYCGTTVVKIPCLYPSTIVVTIVALALVIVYIIQRTG